MAIVSISENIKRIRKKIDTAKLKYGKSQEVMLLAISKTKSIASILEAYNCGQRCFGENYLQEAQNKIESLKDYPDIEWHFVGNIQSNKAKKIIADFSWVHTVDRFKLAFLLDKHLAAFNDDHGIQKKINVCIQVNISGETSKSGCKLSEVSTLANKIIELPNLKLRGLMGVPMFTTDFDLQLERFKVLTDLYDSLSDLNLDTLSMGMTKDADSAIASGSTILRIGTDIFGARE